MIYSLFPAAIASLFLGFGLYIISTKGFNRVTLSFFAMCLTSACWQGTWAVLFQVKNPEIDMMLIRFGYLLILFLPTTLYQFLTEISETAGERRYLQISYCVAGALTVALLFTDWLVAGYYQYFWGAYPRAGWLHPLHVLQTCVVVCRGLYVTYRKQQTATGANKIKLQLCISAVFVYFLAAVDYLCNYGVEFYPPGVFAISVSLGILALATVKHGLMRRMLVVSTVAHEVRTPLASIRNLASGLDRHLPALLEGYILATDAGLVAKTIRPSALDTMASFGNTVTNAIDRTNNILDMMLAYVKAENIDTSIFTTFSIAEAINEALRHYAFDTGEREKVHLHQTENFNILGSTWYLELVFFNLLKNALSAIAIARKGEVYISTVTTPTANYVYVKDTGVGVSHENMPYIFDELYTTKKSGSGIGLAYCRTAMTAFGGSIRCDSVLGQETTFILEFPALPVCSTNDRGASKKSAKLSTVHS